MNLRFTALLFLISAVSCSNPEPKLRTKVEKDLSTSELLFANDCFSCHRLYSKSIGPSYIDISNRYENSQENRKRLSGKIREGGGGIWGGTMMSEHPFLTQEQALKMTKWILDLKDEKLEGSSPSLFAMKQINGENEVVETDSVRIGDPIEVSEYANAVILTGQIKSNNVSRALFYWAGKEQLRMSINEIVLFEPGAPNEVIGSLSLGTQQVWIRIEVNDQKTLTPEVYWMTEYSQHLTPFGTQ